MAAAAAAATAGGYPDGAGAAARPVVEFAALPPAPDVAFWRRLMAKKLDELRLDDRAVPVQGFYEAPASESAPPKLFLTGDAFDEQPGLPPGSVVFRGDLKNFNRTEEFREFLTSMARGARIDKAACELRDAIVSGEALKDPVLLRPMVMISFADLKKYHFAYTAAMPVLCPPGPDAWRLFAETQGAVEAGISRASLSALSQQLRDDAALAQAGAFLLQRGGDSKWAVRPLAALQDVAGPSAELAVGFVDCSAGAAPGWPLRNLILAVAHHRPGRWQVLAFRDPHLCSQRGDQAAVRSRVFHIDAGAKSAAAVLTSPPPQAAQFAGWSKIQNFDLTAFLDQKRIAADAVDLNVKLMKWRLLPELVPERMKELRVLLLGSGTLGCAVARTLMGWGVRKMTFVDSGKVSLSNPVRQSLFTHQDAAERRSKSLAAAEAVQAVMPDAEAQHVELEIPMPGHPHQNAETLRKSVDKLQDLITSHDVVCMLTDSRESRWLPSLMVSALNRKPGKTPPPLGITVALGFDSFLVSRQTYRETESACYFCNDVTAPADSIAFRTLDQQCTVTRPGVSPLASSLAVELIAALVQHQDGFGASFGGAASTPSPLGKVPHQIRGYLADYRLAPNDTEPFTKCICCSKGVLDKYEEDGNDFIFRIVNDSSELEVISGLKEMKRAVCEQDVINFDDFDDDM